MKKFIKIFLISLSSLLAILLILVSVVLFMIFKPERFTPVVRNQVDKLITCRSEIGSVELTFFSTFPEFGVKIRHFGLFNPVHDSRNDTLIYADELVGTLDAAAWWKKDEIKVTGLLLRGGSVNIFSDSLGKTNYNIMVMDTTLQEKSSKETSIPSIELRNIVFDDINLSYSDMASKINTLASGLSAKITGSMDKDRIRGEIKVSKSLVSLEYAGEKYLQASDLRFDLPLELKASGPVITFSNALVSVNDLGFRLNGTIINDNVNKEILTDISYQLDSWSLDKLLAMVPPSMTSYIKDYNAEGLISSEGSIKGSFSESAMPLMDIHLVVEKGGLKYAALPLTLKNIEADLSLKTDLKTDSVSSLKINRFSARTPHSSVSTEGLIDHLYSDISCNLRTSAGLSLDEMNPLIPDSLKIRMSGTVSGRINSAFSLKQLNRMQFEKMKFSGSLSLANLDAGYDSLDLRTDHSSVVFSIPGKKSSSKFTKFAFISVNGKTISISKTESYSAFLQNASMTVETSDFRDTTRVPDLICDFAFDSVSAEMDTMDIAIAGSQGRVTLAPADKRPLQPKITLLYASKQLKALMGQSSVSAGAVSIDSDITNDKDQKEIFLQWPVKGFVNLNNGVFDMAGLTHPVDIPVLKIRFDPEKFNIEESRFRINKSDFSLSGDLNNIFSYFRGDSILRGRFNFASGTTDIAELMALTSGIGTKDSTMAAEAEAREPDTTYAGPYMVPTGMDLLLNTSIKTATLGSDTATNVNGSVRIHDGVLVLDGLNFRTPAARMQLTAIYRTPRKNHLFLGLDYHMLDVEIGELLSMIPDIDTLMPMLRSFRGKGEFHIAVETYLDSLYNIKKSTLRGASSIKGNDLVLMDGETDSTREPRTGSIPFPLNLRFSGMK